MKKIFRAKICVPAPLVATSVLTQNKGPGTEAHFWNLPPPLLRRAPMPSPPAKQFSGRHALEGKGPQRAGQERLDRRLEEVAKAVWGGYCRLEGPLKPALAGGGKVAGHRLGALEVGGGGGYLPPFQCITREREGVGGRRRRRREGGGGREEEGKEAALRTLPAPPCPPRPPANNERPSLGIQTFFCPHPPPPSPCVTFRLVVAPLRGPGQSPVLPFACCVGSLLSVGRCGRCSCWCRFRVRGAQYLVCWGCAECGMVCRLRVSGAQ